MKNYTIENLDRVYERESPSLSGPFLERVDRDTRRIRFIQQYRGVLRKQIVPNPASAKAHFQSVKAAECSKSITHMIYWMWGYREFALAEDIWVRAWMFNLNEAVSLLQTDMDLESLGELLADIHLGASAKDAISRDLHFDDILRVLVTYRQMIDTVDFSYRLWRLHS